MIDCLVPQMVTDILLALKRHGRTLYWFGNEDAVAALVKKRVDKVTRPLGAYRRQSTSVSGLSDDKSERDDTASDKEVLINAG